MSSAEFPQRNAREAEPEREDGDRLGPDQFIKLMPSKTVFHTSTL